MRFVPLVYRAITRTRPTWTRASNVQLGMPNRRPGKRRALNAVLVNSMVMLVWLHVNRARKTRITATKEEIRRALVAPLVGLRRRAVLNAKPVVRERMVQGVNSALRVSTEEQKIQRNYVWVAQLVTVKAMKDKLLAQNVVQVNSITFPMPLNVNPVLKTLITATKVEIRRA